MHHAFKEALPQIKMGELAQAEIEREILAGRFTVLANEKGEFNRASDAPSKEASTE
jgi:hypothetical protein